MGSHTAIADQSTSPSRSVTQNNFQHTPKVLGCLRSPMQSHSDLIRLFFAVASRGAPVAPSVAAYVRSTHNGAPI